MPMERVRTYVPGFDELVNGGIPECHTVLVAGPAGSGKTIFSLQYLYEGMKHGEKGVYISFDMSEKDLVEQASEFGWKFTKDVMIKYIDLNETNVSAAIDEIAKAVGKFKPSRLVIDSISILSVYAELVEMSDLVDMLKLDVSKTSMVPHTAITRRAMTTMLKRIKSFDVTSLLISEYAEGSGYYSRDTVSEFLADGLVVFHNSSGSGRNVMEVEVVKMRKTKKDGAMYDMMITEKGIHIYEIKRR